MAKIGIDGEKFFKEYIEEHYEELSKRTGDSVQKAIKDEMETYRKNKIPVEEALQSIILTSVGAATGETITFLVSAMGRAIDVNNAKLYFELIGNQRKSKGPSGKK